MIVTRVTQGWLTFGDSLYDKIVLEPRDDPLLHRGYISPGKMEDEREEEILVPNPRRKCSKKIFVCRKLMPTLFSFLDVSIYP
jgi:hypothetical protein